MPALPGTASTSERAMTPEALGLTSGAVTGAGLVAATSLVPGPMAGPVVGRCAQGGPWATDQPNRANSIVALNAC